MPGSRRVKDCAREDSWSAQVTGAKVEAVQVPSRQDELLARKLKDKETRAAKKQRKAPLEKIQEDANRVNSERFMQGFLGN
jgi:hypothetical protein